ncbi:MAG: hypothetical protein ACT6FF_08815, partial [Methanosarcinaceae archaeon]
NRKPAKAIDFDNPNMYFTLLFEVDTIHSMKFYNREDELQELNLLRNAMPSIIVLIGRHTGLARLS